VVVRTIHPQVVVAAAVEVGQIGWIVVGFAVDFVVGSGQMHQTSSQVVVAGSGLVEVHSQSLWFAAAVVGRFQRDRSSWQVSCQRLRYCEKLVREGY